MTQEQIQFYEQFHTQEKEILALTQTSVSGYRGGKDTFWKFGNDLLAYIDLETKELIQTKCDIVWLVSEQDQKIRNFKYSFEAEKIYHLKVRESIATEYNPQGHRLLVVDCLQQDVENQQLQAIVEKYNVPVFVQAKGCTPFKLNKWVHCFEGEICWNQQQIPITLDADSSRSKNAKKSIATLETLLENSADWQQKLLDYVGETILDDANEWLEESWQEDDINFVPITKQQLLEKISISEIAVHRNGGFSFYFDDGEIFGGHSIIVEGKLTKGFTKAYLAG